MRRKLIVAPSRVDHGRTDHRLRRAVEEKGTVDLSSQEQAEFDPVLEASLRSFPASDPRPGRA